MIDSNTIYAIPIGRVGENIVNRVEFDIKEINEILPDAQISLLFKRANDAAAYPVNIEISGDILTWIVSNIDTAVLGMGKAELVAKEGEAVKLSKVWDILVCESLYPSVNPPDPFISWFEKIEADANEVQIIKVYVQNSTAEIIEAKIAIQAIATSVEQAQAEVEAIKTEIDGKIDPIESRLADVEDAIPPLENSVTELQGSVAELETIPELIPTQASADNQLADKEFVNSSISTNTAYFKGTFNSVEELEAVTDATNNDYAFVVGTDEGGNTKYDRYKYNADDEEWVFEYTLNNSSFTAEQWSAINSGITAESVAKITENASGISALGTRLTQAEAETARKQDKLTAGNGVKIENNVITANAEAYLVVNDDGLLELSKEAPSDTSQYSYKHKITFADSRLIDVVGIIYNDSSDNYSGQAYQGDPLYRMLQGGGYTSINNMCGIWTGYLDVPSGLIEGMYANTSSRYVVLKIADGRTYQILQSTYITDVVIPNEPETIIADGILDASGNTVKFSTAGKKHLLINLTDNPAESVTISNGNMYTIIGETTGGGLKIKFADYDSESDDAYSVGILWKTVDGGELEFDDASPYPEAITTDVKSADAGKTYEFNFNVYDGDNYIVMKEWG